MKPLFNSTRKGTEAFITSSNEQTSIDRKKKKKEEEAMSELPDLKYIYVCVCVCVCIQIHTSDSKWGIAQFWIHFDIE